MTAPTQESACDRLATKADLERVRVEVEMVRVDMERNRAEARADIERLRADVSRWMLRLGVALISAAGVIAGVVLAVVKLT